MTEKNRRRMFSLPVPFAAGWLLIDAGNSRIKWGYTFQPGVLLAHGIVPENAASAIQWQHLQPTSVWISSVAGQTGVERIHAWLDLCWPHVPRHWVRACASQCGVRNGYDNPEQLGSDRWASLIGAHAAYPGEHLLIATCGTATTLEALDADGQFTGGLIAPGLHMMLRSLGEHTAQLPLPKVNQGMASGEWADVPGRDAHAAGSFARQTVAAMRQGCVIAQAALIERAWQQRTAHLQQDIKLVLSGGEAHTIAPQLSIPYRYHEYLVLDGVARIAADSVEAS